ncbi:MAG: ATP-binding protein [Nitrospinaceae bacterium]
MEPREIIVSELKNNTPSWWMYLTIGGMGLLFAGMVGYSFHLGDRMNRVYSPLIDAAMEIKLEAAIAHLWFEEILSGDRNEDMQLVWKHLEQSDWYARAMLEGGTNSEGIFIPLDDRAMRLKIQEVRKKLAEFMAITQKRLKTKETSGAGTDIDQRYDAVFEEFLREADEVETRLQQIMGKDLSHFRLTQILLIGSSFLLTLFVGVSFYRFERKMQHEAEEKKQSLFQFPSQNPNPILRVDRNGKVLYANAQAVRVLRFLNYKTDAPDPDLFQPFIQEAFGFNSSVEFETNINNRTFWFQIWPFQGTDYVNIYGHDITNRIRAEEKIKATATELERSNQELRDFNFIASHDLQEPLRKIIIFGDRLESSIPKKDKKVRDYLNRMQKSAARMRQLIDGLLQFSACCNFPHPQPYRDIDLKGVVEDVLSGLEARIKETGGSVRVKSLPILEADGEQMRQLFYNLIGNALKFQREGMAPNIRLDSSKNGNGTWKIRVRDNGIGFDPHYANRIFKPFERLHRKNDYEGCGMGLAICKKIVFQHRGNISAHGAPNHGTTFTITLPEKQNPESNGRSAGLLTQYPANGGFPEE